MIRRCNVGDFDGVVGLLRQPRPVRDRRERTPRSKLWIVGEKKETHD